VCLYVYNSGTGRATASKRPENWHSSYTAAHAGEAWVALGLGQHQVQVGLAAGGVIHCGAGR